MREKKKKKIQDISILVILTLVSISVFLLDSVLKSLRGPWFWQYEPLHSALEIFGALAAILMAVFLLQKVEEERKGIFIWIALGFLFMGLLDGFHALFPFGDNFVFLHSIGSLMGGMCFALIWLPESLSAIYISRKKMLVWSAIVFSLLLSISLLLIPEYLPTMISDGEFTSTAVSINVLSGFLFLIAGVKFFITFYNTGSLEPYLFVYLTMFFGLGNLSFGLSSAWNIEWWAWHILRLIAYGVTLGVVSLDYITTREMASQAQKATRYAYAELEQIFNSAADGMIVINKEQAIIRINDTLCTLLDIPKNEILGKHCYDVLHNPVCDTLHCPLTRVLKGEDYIETDMTLYRRDGVPIFCILTVTTLRNPAGEIIGVVEDFKDITERKLSEEAIRESEEKYAALVEHAKDGISIIQDGVFIFVNRAGAEIIGYPEEELIGMPYLKTIAEGYKKQAEQRYEAHLKGRKVPSFFEVDLVRKDGTIRNGEITTDLIQIHGKPAVMTITRDITERKESEKEKRHMYSQLLQSQKMEAVGILAGGVAHDFNNLLTIIQGHLSLIMMNIEETDPLTADLKQIRSSALQAADLTRRLLLFSRRQPMELTLVDINQLIENFLKLLHRIIGEDITIELDLEPILWTARADQGNIEQVIMNLAVNARDAMPRGGVLKIKTENTTVEEEECKIIPDAKPGKYVCLSITDIGIGMDKKTTERIFEPFYTTKSPGKGTGLGLSVVYGIIRQHDGFIRVSSEPEKGATFALYLPAFSEKLEKESKEEKVPREKLKGRGEEILVIEDDEGVRKLMATALRRNGYRVMEAVNAQEAFNFFTREKKKFALIISDVILPDQTGLELIDRFFSLQPGLPILLISGYPGEKSEWSAIQEKGLPFLRKPFTVDNLLFSVKKILNQSMKKI